ncbi:Hypothetical predicted protein, partial [Marmota monax]
WNWYLIWGQQSKCVYNSGLLGDWEFTGSEEKTHQHCRETKANVARPKQIKDCARMGAHAGASSWGELEPCGMRRRDHTRGPVANLELWRGAESELTFPADQMGSDQRARWNYCIQHEVPFRTRARAAQLCQGHTEETRMSDPRGIRLQD